MAAGAAVSIAAFASSASAQVYTWANNTSTTPQNWGTGTNWVGPAPVAGGSLNDSIILNYNFGSGAFASNNNLAGAYLLNNLTMNAQAAGGFSLTATAGSTLNFVTNGSGGLPTLVNSSSSASTISSLITLTNDTTISGAGVGGLTLSGVLSGPGRLIIGTTGPGVVNLGAANTHTGGTTINSGEVAISNATGLGPAGSTVTINGGRLRLAGAASLTLAQNFNLNSTLNITGPSSTAAVNPTFSGTITGTGGITNRPTASSTATFSGASNFTGAYYGQAFGNAVPSVTLNGNGAWTGVSSLTLEANQTLLLDNATTNVNNRLNDAAPINLYRSGLQVNGNATAATSELVGALTFSGSSAIAAVPNAAQNTTLTVASMNRVNRGTLVLTGTALGSTPAAGNSNIISASLGIMSDLQGGGGLAGSTNINVLPYAYGVNTVGGLASGQLMTYDSVTGFRPLAANEYVPSITGMRGTATLNNIKAIGAPQVKKDIFANAIVSDSASAAAVGGGIYGSATVTPASGALLFSISGGGTASTFPSILSVGSLDFGKDEGIIHTQNFAAITNPIVGINGITKAGFAALHLTGNNTYTGTTTVAGSILHVPADTALGAPDNPIVLTGGNVSGISFSPSVLLSSVPDAQSMTINRPVTVAEAGGGFSAVLNSSTLTINGQISGNGRFLSGTGFLGNTGVVKLTNTNTYSGPTVIFGNLAVTSDAALGTNSEVVATGGFLRADGPFTSNRNFTVNGNNSTTQASFPIITNGFDMTLNGTISNQGASTATTLGSIIKGGTNTLTLTGNSQYNGNIQVGLASPLGDMSKLEMGGTLAFSGPNGAMTAAANANILSGATLRLDNSTDNNTNRLNANVVVGGGTFDFVGNSSAASTETIGTLTAGNFAPAIGNGVGIVNINPGSGQSAVVTASGFTRSLFAGMLVRSPNLGGAIGANTGNLVFNTAPTLTNNIIPGMVGDTSLSGNGSGFVTHVAGTGVRLLTSGEYGAMPTSGATTTNVDTSAATVLTGATTVNAIRIGGGGSIDATGQTLTVTSGMILATGGGNGGLIGGTLAFASAPATIWANDNTSVSSIISGTGGMNKAGPGTLTLNTPATVTGGTLISNGRLTYGVANALPAGQNVTVGTTDGSVGTLDINGTTSSIGALQGMGNVELGNGGNLTSTVSGQFGGTVSGTGNIIINGSAITHTLTGASTFTGQYRITNGTLAINANQPVAGNGSLGAAGNSIVLGDAPAATTFGTLTPGSNVTRIAAPITVNGAAIAADATTSTINSTTGNNAIWSGTITVNRLLRLGGGTPSTTGHSGSNILTGNITDGSLPGGIDFFNGSHSLWGNNTFTGGLFMNSTASAYLGLGSDTALGTGFLKITSFAGNLHADNGARSIANNTYFTSANATTLGVVGANNFNFSGNWDLGGGDFVGQTPASAAGARTLRILNRLTTLSGVVSGTAAATLTKDGGGTLELTGTNTFAGNVTVNGGSLLVNGSNNGIGAYTVNAGALLGGSGTIFGAVSMATNSIFEPGNSAGNLTTGALTLATGSILQWELGDSTILAASDRATVNGNLSVAGGTGTVILNIEALAGFALLPGTTSYTIMTYSGTLTGSAANFLIGNVPGFVTGASIDTTTFPGQVVLNLVPTPSTGGLLALAGVFAARRRRR